MKKPIQKLIYFFAETHYYSQDTSVLVVNIVGPLVKENLPVFKECHEEISKFKSKCIVVNFRDVVPNIDQSFLPLLDELQKTVRAKPAHLRFSGIHPDLRKVLLEKGITTIEELTNNLAEALQSFPDTSNINNAA